MRKPSIAFLILMTCALARADPAEPKPETQRLLKHDWLIVPGVRVGPITARSSESGLRRYFGWENVAITQVDIGEGDTVTGTVIFPTEGAKTLEITWKDRDAGKYPDRVVIHGERSLWRTRQGITLGISLTQIEALNGGPVTIAGFGWDYGGTVIDAADGKLTFLGAHGGLFLRLNPSEASIEKLPKEEFDSVLGDGSFSSQHPAMQKLNPAVHEIVVIFR